MPAETIVPTHTAATHTAATRTLPPSPSITTASSPPGRASGVVIDPDDPVFALHRGGKLEVVARTPLRDRADLSLAYTPGVAQVCRAIAADPGLVDVYTGRGNTVAVVTDGTAVLGLGDIGPAAALPVMEGKALLFKHFGGVDAVPICLDTTDVDELVDTVARLAPGFGGINLEDISAPRCFEVERRLQERLALPVFHDDQHGTAVVVLAGLINAARVLGREPATMRVVISGAGAAGAAIAAILARSGVREFVVCDRGGILGPWRAELPPHKRALATGSAAREPGGLAEALVGADVFIGVSGGQVPAEVVSRMAPGSVIFALANPDPEVDPQVAARYAAVVGTGRSDLPNQINNVLAFPGIFRGALDCGARRITEGMKLAAATAIADCVSSPSVTEVVPSVFDPRVAPAVAEAVGRAARSDGVTP